jgi:hypothetical protein
MIIKDARFAIGIVMLSLIGVFVSGEVFARQGPGMTRTAAGQNKQKSQTTDFTGDWTLNKNLSDDPAKVMESMHSEGGGGSGRGSWMHGGGGSKGMGPEQRQTMRGAIEAPARLMITQTTDSITFTKDDGHSQTFKTNSKKEKVPLGNQTVEVRTKWDDDGHLVKETSLAGGVKLTETYSLISASQQLQVIVKLDAAHLPRPVLLTRIYDAQRAR